MITFGRIDSSIHEERNTPKKAIRGDEFHAFEDSEQQLCQSAADHGRCPNEDVIRDEIERWNETNYRSGHPYPVEHEPAKIRRFRVMEQITEARTHQTTVWWLSPVSQMATGYRGRPVPSGRRVKPPSKNERIPHDLHPRSGQVRVPSWWQMRDDVSQHRGRLNCEIDRQFHSIPVRDPPDHFFRLFLPVHVHRPKQRGLGVEPVWTFSQDITLLGTSISC